MKTKERIELYLGMLQCSYPLYMWTYDTDMELLSSTVPGEFSDADFLSMMGFSELLTDYLEKGGKDPVVLSNSFGILFFGAIEWKNSRASKVYVFGPAASGHNSDSVMRGHLDAHDIPVAMRITISREYEKLPVIPSASLLPMVRMLQYCVNEEYIDNTRIQYLFTKTSESQTSAHTTASQSDAETGESSGYLSDHSGIYEAEERFLSMIREGNPDYKKAFTKSSTLSSGIPVTPDDPLRSAKNNLLVLLTLVSRAAITGGLSPAISYSLNDLYVRRIEKCISYSQTSRLANEFLDDYVTRIRRSKTESGISLPIRSACEYIQSHVKEKIAIAFLADKAGYTEYYFSHKFQKETGMTVSEYVRKTKMEEAKRLLLNTSMSITEISDELSLGSRSSFFTAFRKEYGCSPSKLREQ